MNTKLEDKIEYTNALLSFSLTLLYAISTYFPSPVIPGFVYVELPILTLLSLDWLLFFYMS